MKISICVATYRRPLGLERLLAALGRLEFAKCPTPEIEIIVVDNDPQGSARPICDAAAHGSPHALIYVEEPTRGISAARNRAVATASPASKYVAFIDDDEFPEPPWIDALLAAAASFSADVVAGPVVPEFEEEPPRWIVEGRFFERPRYEDGSAIERVSTANVFVSAQVFKLFPQPFDSRFGLSGGEDSHFFEQLRRAGYRMVWAEGAVVREVIPPARVRTAWLLQRSYRGGNAWTRSALVLDPSASTVARRLTAGLVRGGGGIVRLIAGLVRGRVPIVRALQRICLGTGAVTGVFGLTFLEYGRRRPDGR